ncbi:hypothetical protein BASA50_002397 [Batrachochytrium salamandrivorans]|uniref:Uncharacterized protein n=1 Tax=Batrachochytrium salamandrivorans TaxID=1357716 RepID=A0ABQ8FLJ7_9FUNG|nr:hypothetical protein BASA50_002397 [Batrachochytrium salamandrivorans]
MIGNRFLQQQASSSNVHNQGLSTASGSPTQDCGSDIPSDTHTGTTSGADARAVSPVAISGDNATTPLRDLISPSPLSSLSQRIDKTGGVTSGASGTTTNAIAPSVLSTDKSIIDTFGGSQSFNSTLAKKTTHNRTGGSDSNETIAHHPDSPAHYVPVSGNRRNSDIAAQPRLPAQMTLLSSISDKPLILPPVAPLLDRCQ